MIITKSKYINYMTCSRLAHLKEFYPNEEQVSEYKQMLAIEGIEVGKVGRSYFGDYILVEGKNKVEKTKEYIDAGYKVIAEAAFFIDDFYCAVDLLKVDEDGVEIYEIKSSSNLEDRFVDDVSFQTYVLKKLGYNVKNSYILYINSNYVLKDKLDLHKLFNISRVQIDNNVEENINNYRKEYQNLPPLKACKNCVSGDCSYFNYCFSHLPKNNIFKLSGLRNSYNYYNEGIITFNDYLNRCSNNSGIIHSKILEQINYELNDIPEKVNKKNLNDFLNTLEYPLYYLDFETIRKPIPKYPDYKSNQRIIIQYSLHIQEYIKGPLIHKEYLLTEDYDNREEVAERLINDLGTKGSIIAYHSSYEAGVIKELIDLVPKHKNQLNELINRIVDLEMPFRQRDVYNKNMCGKSSIKLVLPAMCPDYEQSYKNLSLVHNGVDAMTMYNKMIVSTGEEKERIINGLLEYCCLDTKAMVVVLEKLYDL